MEVDAAYLMNDPDEPGVFRIPADDGNRATVAMVLRTVDDLKELTRAQFESVHTRLDLLSSLPTEMHLLKERQLLTEARLTVIEKSDTMMQTTAEKKREYRAGTLPLILIGGLATIVNAVLFFVPH